MRIVTTVGYHVAISAIIALSPLTASHVVGQGLGALSPGAQQLRSSFYENIGVGWSLRGDQWFANFGGGQPAGPAFGGGGGFAGGFGFGGPAGGLGFRFAQGSDRSISSTSGSLTTMDGMPGSIQSGVIRPFVTGVTPIVGDYPRIVDPSEVSRQIGSQQLSTLRQSQAARRSNKLDEYIRRAELAESEGNKRMARANYRGAIALAPEPLRSQLRVRMAEMLRRPD